MSRLLVRVMGFLVLGGALLLASEPSVEKMIGGYSAVRFLLIVALSCFGGVLLFVSRTLFWSQRFLLGISSSLISFLLAEWLLWWNPLLLPVSVIHLMPRHNIQRAVQIDSRQGGGLPRRRFSFDALSENYVTEGYLRHYIPNFQGALQTEDDQERWVWVKIDEVGFRNPPGLYTSHPHLTVYADWAKRIEGAADPERWRTSWPRQQRLAQLLSEMALRQGVFFVDLTPQIRALSQRERLYGDLGHFNQLGYQRYAELLFEKLRPLMLTKTDLEQP